MKKIWRNHLCTGIHDWLMWNGIRGRHSGDSEEKGCPGSRRERLYTWIWVY